MNDTGDSVIGLTYDVKQTLEADAGLFTQYSIFKDMRSIEYTNQFQYTGKIVWRTKSSQLNVEVLQFSRLDLH